jgi:hypothetical protein
MKRRWRALPWLRRHRASLWCSFAHRKHHRTGSPGCLIVNFTACDAGGRGFKIEGRNAMKNVICIATAILLAGCARGGGIGLEAMLADSTCEQQGFRLGTPEYARCRQAAFERSRINAAAAMAGFDRQQAELAARMNRQQMCSYNGQTINGNTSGTMTCQ